MIQSNVERVSPALARELLERNAANRPVDQRRVKDYARMMREGKWALNGEAVQVSSSGRLLNGQHRMRAVIHANVAVNMLVVRGVDEDVFATYDSGKVRSRPDVLALLGYKNAQHLSAALAVVHAYFTEELSADGWPAIPKTELESTLNAYPQLPDYVSRTRGNRAPFDSAWLAAVFYIFACSDLAAAESFMKALSTGELLEAKDPAYLLRERILREAGSKSRRPVAYLVALSIKACEARRVGKRMRYLRFREEGDKSELFPRIGVKS